VYRLLPLCHVYNEVRIGFSESKGLLLCFLTLLLLQYRDQRLEYGSFIILSVVLIPCNGRGRVGLKQIYTQYKK